MDDYCRVLIWGVLHCRCERSQTQQAQYNEFGREASSRTGPLRGLRQRSGRIVMEQERQRRKGGVEVCPRASSEDEFFFSSSDITQLELSGVFQIAIPFRVASVGLRGIHAPLPKPSVLLRKFPCCWDLVGSGWWGLDPAMPDYHSH